MASSNVTLAHKIAWRSLLPPCQRGAASKTLTRTVRGSSLAYGRLGLGEQATWLGAWTSLPRGASAGGVGSYLAWPAWGWNLYTRGLWPPGAPALPGWPPVVGSWAPGPERRLQNKTESRFSHCHDDHAKRKAGMRTQMGADSIEEWYTCTGR